MNKIQKLYSKENENKNKRKNIVINSTYALIACLSVVLGATLIAVNVNTNSKNNATIQTSTKTQNYISPLENATVLKDYNSGELQYNDTLKQWEIHKAIDLVSDTSNQVHSIASGTVTNIYKNYLEGTVIEISHTDGFVSVYKSLSDDVKVKLGDAVKQGSLLGSTATSMSREANSGNHLHFEMYLNNIAINPNDYIDFSTK